MRSDRIKNGVFQIEQFNNNTNSWDFYQGSSVYFVSYRVILLTLKKLNRTQYREKFVGTLLTRVNSVACVYLKTGPDTFIGISPKTPAVLQKQGVLVPKAQWREVVNIEQREGIGTKVFAFKQNAWIEGEIVKMFVGNEIFTP
jgi:hypothetical protein